MIIVDDGACEAIINEITEYLNKDSRLIYIQNKHNLDLPALRLNQAIQLARGDYISYLFSDEFYMNDALESLYNVISSKQKPSLVFGYARIEEVDKNTNINTENSYNTDNNKTTTTNNNTSYNFV